MFWNQMVLVLSYFRIKKDRHINYFLLQRNEQEAVFVVREVTHPPNSLHLFV